MQVIHVYAPPPADKSITIATCPDCKRRTRMIQFFYEWFGWDSTCLRCGRHWQGGEWTALDFVRKSRQKSIDNAKRKWRADKCK